jgi:SAM-dependent methyltransferase
MIIFLLIFELLILFAVGSFLIFFCVIPLFIGAPYVKSKKERVETMMRLADLKPNDLVIDLGSGDGLFVIGAARRGAKAIGYEINPILVWWSRHKIRDAAKRASPEIGSLGRNENRIFAASSLPIIKSLGFSERVKIYRKSFWSVDLSSATCVMLYGITGMMKRLEKKLERELKPGTKIISNGFSFPNWKPKIKESGVYLYIKK